MDDNVVRLANQLQQHKISRRTFIKGALLSGLSVSSIGALLAACAPQPASPTAPPTTAATSAPATDVPPTAAPTPAGPIGTLTIGIAGDISGMEPHVNRDFINVTSILQNLYDLLVLTDSTGTVVPQLADSWDLVNPTTWEFKLHPGVTFHNGEPFNAETVKFNFERKLSGDRPRHGTVEKLALSTVTVVDELTVRVETPTPSPAFLQDLQTLFIVPPGYLQEVGDEGFIEHPVGTGPYKFVEYAKGDHITMEAFPDYFAGAPHIQKLVWRILPEEGTRVAALKSGEVDLITQVPVDALEDLENNAEPALTVSIVPMNQVVYLQLWDESPKCSGDGCTAISNKLVRQAMAHAINLPEISEFLYRNTNKPPASVVSSITYGFDPSLQPYSYDPDRARQLLAEAGYENGFTIDVDFGIMGISKMKELIEAVAAYWSQVGITANLNQREDSLHIEEKLGFTIGPVFNWNFRGWDAGYILYNQVRKGGTWFFYPGWTQQVDDLIYAQEQEMDEPTRLGQLQELLRLMHDDMPWIPLVEASNLFAMKTTVGGWVAQPESNMKMNQVFLQA